METGTETKVICTKNEGWTHALIRVFLMSFLLETTAGWMHTGTVAVQITAINEKVTLLLVSAEETLSFIQENIYITTWAVEEGMDEG